MCSVLTVLLCVLQNADSFASGEVSAAARPAPRPLLGSSLLRPLAQPRNCHSLHIPFEYCLCKYIKAEPEEPADLPEARRIALLAVERMNADIRAAGFADRCVELRLNDSAPLNTIVYGVHERKGYDTYKVGIQVQPSGGTYDVWATVSDFLGGFKSLGMRLFKS